MTPPLDRPSADVPGPMPQPSTRPALRSREEFEREARALVDQGLTGADLARALGGGQGTIHRPKDRDAVRACLEGLCACEPTS